MALNLSRKVHFLQFCADFSKKPKSVKAIYIFHLKVLTILFQKMIWFIGTQFGRPPLLFKGGPKEQILITSPGGEESEKFLKWG